MDIKKISVEYGLFLAIVIVAFAIICLLVFSSRGVWDKNLRKQVELVMENSFASEYRLGDPIEVNNTFSVSAAAYELFDQSQQTDSCVAHGIIIRVPSLYGPVPAVFIQTEDGLVEFVGVAENDGNTMKELAIIENLKGSIQIDKWKARIPHIVPFEKKAQQVDQGASN